MINIQKDYDVTGVCYMLFGSNLYGTATENSDTDIRSIHIPSKRDIILGKAEKSYSYSSGDKDSKNGKHDIDYQSYSLLQFIEMGIRGDIVVLDMIHSDDVNVNPEYAYVWDFIRANRHKFYTTNMKSYMGYINNQAAIYGIKGSRISCLKELINFMEVHRLQECLKFSDYIDLLPENKFCKKFVDEKNNLYYEVLGKKYQSTISGERFETGIQKQYQQYGQRVISAEMNNGIDWKSLHHALRAGFQLLEIYGRNDLRFPLEKRKFLIDVKAGKKDFSHVKKILESLIECVDIEASRNQYNLPDEVDKEFWYNFVYKVYSGEIK